MKNSKVKGLLGLLVLLFAVGLFGFFGYDTMDDIKLGLDLAGGVSITYQAVDENPTSEEMSDTIYKLQQRVQNYSTEAVVYQEGSDRINIDIPGVSDANAILEELGKPGSLIFTDETGKTILTGDQVASAKAGIIEQNGQKSYVVSLTSVSYTHLDVYKRQEINRRSAAFVTLPVSAIATMYSSILKFIKNSFL